MQQNYKMMGKFRFCNLSSYKIVLIIFVTASLITIVVYSYGLLGTRKINDSKTGQKPTQFILPQTLSVDDDNNIDTNLSSSKPNPSVKPAPTSSPTSIIIPTSFSNYSNPSPTTMVIPTFSPTPTPTLYPNYIYDNDYPILLRMEGFGETYYNSHGNGVSGPYFLNKVYHPGDTLHIRTEAYDPKGRKINYKIELNTPLSLDYYASEASITLTETDIRDSVGLTVSITVDTPYHRFSDHDDYMQFNFSVKP